MKFKVGDKVRLTREAIASKEDRNYRAFELEVLWVEVIAIKNGMVVYKYRNRFYWNEYEANLELVPEEPEFEFGEEIEVRDEIGAERKRVIFLCKTTANDTHQYITADISKKSFDNGARFHNNSWRFARKARPKLIRKEIAEKFWVSEDFVLVD